ncbi:hypothetical protein L917_02403 [Phytophthora nicotianae]|uniref:Uncharacterized protein n=1 Tax=Phytophthora nicotianae TaxID=4792 RepID=W2LU65_PHYNI|nr:hypothetical protein L917_02403 [Phytophthora nicotianae]
MVAVSRRENGAATANDVEQWAVAITKQWSAEVRLEISREKHRARTTRYRSRRQASQEAMIREHQRLEETLRRGLAAAKHTLARDGEGQGRFYVDWMAMATALNRQPDGIGLKFNPIDDSQLLLGVYTLP